MKTLKEFLDTSYSPFYVGFIGRGEDNEGGMALQTEGLFKSVGNFYKKNIAKTHVNYGGMTIPKHLAAELDAEHTKKMANISKPPAPTIPKEQKPKAEIDYANHVQNLHDTLAEHHETLRLSHEHDAAIGQYTGSHSTSLNTGLYNGQKLTNIQETIKRHLDDGMKRSQLPMDVQVHSGVGFSPERYRVPGQRGPIRVKLPAYTSTSLDKNVASEFGSHDPTSEHVYMKKDYLDHEAEKLKPEHAAKVNRKKYDLKTIENNSKITDGHYGDKRQMYDYSHAIHLHVSKGTNHLYVGEKSDHEHEYEMILPRNTKLDIHPDPFVDHRNTTVHWHGRVVHDGTKHVGTDHDIDV